VRGGGVPAGSRRVRWRAGEGGSHGTAAEPTATGGLVHEPLAAFGGELHGGVDGDEVHHVLLVDGRWAEVPALLHGSERTDDCGQFESSFCDRVATIDTPARLLRLLVLFSARPTWSATELTTRLEVTTRTLRRDVTRLRDLGYPIESTTGRHGGYALGAGGRLPPLLLDDDEAVAVTIGLRELSGTADPTLGEAAVAALTKLVQVLPSALRERVDTLGEMTIRMHRTHGPGDGQVTDVGVLMALARAARRNDRLRFDYRTGDDRTSRRHVEPHRLVSLRNRWYLVAFDLDRDDWRTFRVDRVGPPVATGFKGVERAAPDAAALVAEGVAVRVYELQARIRFPVPRDVVEREIPPTIAVIEPGRRQATSTTVVMGGDLDWLGRYLSGLPFPFEVLSPDLVRDEVAAHARRLLSYVAPPAPADPSAAG
jgi:predicted DNA-binding transcriptional regulator YafY